MDVGTKDRLRWLSLMTPPKLKIHKAPRSRLPLVHHPHLKNKVRKEAPPQKLILVAAVAAPSDLHHAAGRAIVTKVARLHRPHTLPNKKSSCLPQKAADTLATRLRSPGPILKQRKLPRNYNPCTLGILQESVMTTSRRVGRWMKLIVYCMQVT